GGRDRALLALLADGAEAVEDPVDPVAGEQPHELVLGGEVEARLAGVALAAGAAAELGVDPARLVALGAEDEQAAGLHHLPAVGLDLLLHLREDLVPGSVVLVRALLEPAVGELAVGEVLGVAAELDVDAA